MKQPFLPFAAVASLTAPVFAADAKPNIFIYVAAGPDNSGLVTDTTR